MSRERDFLDVERQDVAYRPAAERVSDFKAVDIPLSEAEIKVQASRCMNCGTPFCHASITGCPLGNVVPEFNACVYAERWNEALDLLLQTNCFPEFTGRICPAPCEGACVLGVIRPAVNICKIELAIIEHAFQSGYIATARPRPSLTERVAVIGSGPAGLATAHVLSQAGVNVTVYEKAAQPGGLLRYGIPDFKLEKWVIDRRLDLMKEQGVVFECGVDAGDDVSCRFLGDRFDAIVLATGAGIPRDLNVPGRELQGIHFAMDFLTQQNRLVAGESGDDERGISAQGKNVVVIGGGDTGSDCIGTSWRQGAKQVVQLEILSEPPAVRAESTPWPQWPLMRRDSSSHKEGDTRRYWSIDTTAFAGKDGRVEHVRCAQVEWVEGDTRGQVCPRRVQGSDLDFEADLVLLAMGFVGPGPTCLIDDLGVEKDGRGFLTRDSRHMTTAQDVFVTGDMQSGPSLVVRAIADGMLTARRVMDHLNIGC